MNTPFRPGTASAGGSAVELKVSARGLLDMDVLSKSDPFCVLRQRDPVSGAWAEVARTETIQNSLEPEWVRPFRLDYFFEEQQALQFLIYDSDSNAKDLASHDFLGSVDCSLGEIVSQGAFERLLKGPKPNAGRLLVRYEEEQAAKEEITLAFAANKLDKKDWFGKSDPFLAFYRANEDGSFSVVHRTEVIKNTLNPTWKPFTLPLRTLCGGDPSRSLLIKCVDWNRDGSEDLIGEVTTNVAELTQQGSDGLYQLMGGAGASRAGRDGVLRKAAGGKMKKAGVLHCTNAKVATFHSFLDFIRSGTQLSCTIGIDFTASNGNPAQSSSLHFLNPAAPNHYVQALSAVGEIVEDYDSDKLFPVLGFGARLPPDGRVSHEFFVNGHESNPYCAGVAGVVGAYQACLSRVQLYGPTNFAPLIHHVSKFAAQRRSGSDYFILLIITDGVITDMPQTKDAIVAASALPLSIIIVGVGQADFAAMEELDGDDDGEFGRLRSSRGVYASRDIVQFVPFRSFVSGGARVSQARLAKEVLAEVPAQFLSFMKANRIVPGGWPDARPATATAAHPPQAPTAPPAQAYPEPPPPYPGQ